MQEKNQLTVKSFCFFPGSGSYKPGSGTTGTAVKGNSYFPVKAFLVLDTANPKLLGEWHAIPELLGSGTPVVNSWVSGMPVLNSWVVVHLS